jgi:GNAT superfamily N-acetyltransferase
MEPNVRPAAADDVEPAIALLEQLFEPPGGTPPGYDRGRAREGFAWALGQDNADVLLAFDGDRLSGLASVYADIESIRFGRRCWLQDLVVDREARSQGIGKALLAAAAGWARDHGCTHLELSSGAGRTDAHRFYEREGMSKNYDFMLWLGE